MVSESYFHFLSPLPDSHDSFDKRGFDWELEDPPPRPNMEAPPRVNIPGTPARRVTTTARVVTPAGGSCQQGSKTCAIL